MSAARLGSSRLVAAGGLGIALFLYSLNWAYTGPFYLLAHIVLVGGAAALSFTLRDGARDGLARTLNLTALALPLLGGHPPASYTWSTVEHLLCESSLLWGPFLLVVVIALGLRWRSLALLNARHAVATCVVVASAPLVIPACLGAAGGLAAFLVVPIVVAAVARAWSWVLGRPSPTANALRRVVPVLVLGGVVIATIATVAPPGAGGSLEPLSVNHLGWALGLFAVALRDARDPIGLAPDQPKPDQGPYR
jgi:hypothetical protein